MITLNTSKCFLHPFTVLSTRFVRAYTTETTLNFRDTTDFLNKRIRQKAVDTVQRTDSSRKFVRITLVRPSSRFRTSTKGLRTTVAIIDPTTNSSRPTANIFIILTIAIPKGLGARTTMFITISFFTKETTSRNILVTISNNFKVDRHKPRENIPQHHGGNITMTLKGFINQNTNSQFFGRTQLFPSISSFYRRPRIIPFLTQVISRKRRITTRRR